MNDTVYHGELLSYPGPWGFYLPARSIILVTDEELEALSDPDRVLNLSLTYEPVSKSLRQVCEEAKAAGCRTLVISFDHFFKQYRPGQDKPRRLMPDMDEYVARIAAVGKFAEPYGLGLELGLLTPLEVGRACAAQTGESGRWMHYRKGLRDPVSGAYSVQLWRQMQWANNKGAFAIEDAGVRVFAFREARLRGTPYLHVAPAGIVEITDTASVEVWDDVIKSGDYRVRRVRVHGTGRAGIGRLDRVLVVQQYRTPEMDYFSPKALPFLKGLIDKYADAGVKLNALYSDEMHIQQDWGYFSHHDNGEFALRYVSDGLQARFAEAFGEEYRDLARHLVYFAYGQEDCRNDVDARSGLMHVFGTSAEDIRRTALFRSRYFRLLQDSVVDLFTAAKRYAEERMGRRLTARAHATWAESPTIDRWDTGRENHARNQYEYTPNFVWSCTVHQAASACHDYFKWGDFLTGNGNDHAECGWLDRNYVGPALACSTGILNDVPYSYAAHWGMPAEISRRRQAVANTYGAGAELRYGIVQDLQHRDAGVLMLYPLDLVSVEERFGSWMTQYGYANLVTQAKLLERGAVRCGAVEMAGRRFTTLAAMFEPFASPALLAMMRDLAAAGGRVIWSGPPPVLGRDGERVLDAWQDLFGVGYDPHLSEGLMAPGRQVTFESVLAGIGPQTILTHFLVDHIYPVTPRAETQPAAHVQGHVVGTHRTFPGGGSATVLGYRPRDDQAASLGYETRNWFEVLSALGAYPPTGRFAGANDNTEHLSRTTDYLACRFPNGAVTVCRHLSRYEENWPGGFARKKDEDAALLAKCPPPTERVSLRGFRVNGHTVTYDGSQAVAFRVNESAVSQSNGGIVAFSGADCKAITVDGREYVFSETELAQFAFAPVPEERRLPGGAIFVLMADGAGKVRIPAGGLPRAARPEHVEWVHLVAEGATPGSRGEPVPSQREGDALVFTLTGRLAKRWIYGVV